MKRLLCSRQSCHFLLLLQSHARKQPRSGSRWICASSSTLSSWKKLPENGQQGPGDSADADPLQDSSMGLVQRFKRTFKQYGKVVIPVHLVTSSIWFGAFYYSAMKGVNLVPFLEYIGFPQKLVKLLENSQSGNALTAYALYKIATPARYTVTLGGTSLSVKYLRRHGYMSTPPPVKEYLQEKIEETKDRFSEKIEETKDLVSGKIEETKDRFSEKIEETKDLVSGKIGETKDLVSGKIEETKDRFSEKIEETKDRVSGKIEETKDLFSGKIEETKDLFSGKIEETKDRFSEKIEETKDLVSGKIEETKDLVSGKIEETKDLFSGKIEETKDLVSGKIEETKDKFTEKLQETKDKVGFREKKE